MNAASMSSLRAAAEQPDYEDADPNFLVLSDTEHTARKWHTCWSCEHGIAPGARYWKRVTIEEGEFSVIKYHADSNVCRANRQPPPVAREYSAEELPF